MSFWLQPSGEIVCDTAEEAISMRRLLTHNRRKPKADSKIKRKKPVKSAASRSWARARREARRQNREDVAKVRSELAAAKRYSE